MRNDVVKSPRAELVSVASLEFDERAAAGVAEQSMTTPLVSISRTRSGAELDIHDRAWKMDLNPFKASYISPNSDAFAELSPRLQAFYVEQNQIIASFIRADLVFGQGTPSSPDRNFDGSGEERYLEQILLLSNVFNVILFAMKVVAATMSRSLVIISSLVDSFVDLFTGFAIAIARKVEKNPRNREPRFFPLGRTQLEPLSIVICSAVMATASLELCSTSVQRLATKNTEIALDATTITIMVLTVVIKLWLYVLCRKNRNQAGQALALDHINDVVSNLASLAFAFLAASWWSPLDPIGAISVSLWIIVRWIETGYNELKKLSGQVAEPQLLSLLTYIAANHHPSITAVDSVVAFHMGGGILAQVDIVLDEHTPLRVSHDVAESLQKKIERLVEVNRAFVHVDFETYHSPLMEHVPHYGEDKIDILTRRSSSVERMGNIIT